MKEKMKNSKKYSLEQIDKLKKELNSILESSAKSALMDEFTAIFAKYETIEAFRWIQFTPGFNDGDPCVFSTTDLQYKLVKSSPLTDVVDKKSSNDDEDEDGDFVDEDDDDGGFIDIWHLKDDNKKMYDDIKKFWRYFSDDIALVTFGNDKRITITREGITEEDYDCGYM